MAVAASSENGMRGVSFIAVVLALGMSMIHVAAQVHHVVGGDRGWDPSSNIGLWSIGKVFRVGDNIWFAYSAALESVVQLGTREEFESCDVSNPIRLYTGGLDKVSLDGQGSRYFASANPGNCRNGLKLHVHVRPPSYRVNSTTVVPTERDALAAGPTPSISPSRPLLLLPVVIALLCSVCFAS